MTANPKEFYRTYLADDSLSIISKQVIGLIKEERPVHALEFGGGTGKNICAMDGVQGMSLDISFLNLAKAHLHNNLNYQILGDESVLRHLCNFDVVFTVSVLDHIEEVKGIIGEFKRIANKSIFLAEAIVHEPEKYYYLHDYESFGFVRMPFTWTGEDGYEYGIWRYRHTDVRQNSINDDMG